MLVRIVHTALLFVFLAAAQQPPEQVVTNSDVAAMIKAGLAPATVVRAIDLAAVRGITRFDVSPGALIRMKNQGATTAVLDAMIAAAGMPKRMVPSNAVPGLPLKKGVYYRGPAGMTEMPATAVWPEVDMGWKGLTPTEERRYVLVGPRASLKIRSAQPVFYVRNGRPEDYWQLVKLAARKDRRCWETEPTQAPLLSEPPRIRPDQAVPLDLKRLAGDVFELRPARALGPGEYAIVNTKTSQRWLSKVYPFAVLGEAYE